MLRILASRAVSKVPRLRRDISQDARAQRPVRIRLTSSLPMPKLKGIMIGYKNEPDNQREHRKALIKRGLRTLYLQCLAVPGDFENTMRQVRLLWEKGARFSARVVYALVIRLYQHSRTLGIERKRQLVPFGELVVKGLQQGRMLMMSSVLMFLLRFFIYCDELPKAREFADWFLRESEALAGPETHAELLRLEVLTGNSLEKCESTFRSALKRLTPPEAVFPNEISQWTTLARAMSPEISFHMIEARLKYGDWRGADLDFEGVLYGWSRQLDIEPFCRLWLKYRPLREAQIMADLTTLTGNTVPMKLSVLLFREASWQRGLFDRLKPSTARRERLARERLQNFHSLLSSGSPFSNMHICHTLKAIMELSPVNYVGGSYMPSSDWHPLNQDLLATFLGLLKASKIEMNDEIAAAIISSAGRIGDVELVKTYLEKIEDIEKVFAGSFGSFLFALGRTKMREQLEYYWKMYLQYHPAPHFKNMWKLMLATYECGNLSFFKDHIEARKKVIPAFWIAKLDIRMQKYQRDHAEWAKKQIQMTHVERSAAADEARLAIGAMMKYITSVQDKVLSGYIHDLKNDDRFNGKVVHSSSEKQREQWSKDMFDQKYKDQQLFTTSRLHGQTFRTKTNLAPIELYPYFYHRINELLLSGSYHEQAMWNDHHLAGKQVPDFHERQFGEYNHDLRQSRREANEKAGPKRPISDWYKRKAMYHNWQREQDDLFEKTLDSMSEEQYKSEINRLRREPGFLTS